MKMVLTVWGAFTDCDNGGYPQELLSLFVGDEVDVQDYVKAQQVGKGKFNLRKLNVVEVFSFDAERARDFLTERSAAASKLNALQDLLKSKFE